VPEGNGRADYKNGNSYEGEWLNGKFDGKGTFTWAKGDVYTGYFKDGHRDGNGKYVFKDGTFYDGDWVNDNEEGEGTLTLPGGDMYKGSFKDNYRDGYGTYTGLTGDLFNCPGCRKYAGYWRRDLKEGNGSCFDSRGALIYSGNFSNNKPIDPPYPVP
jgi:hypothetical protein